MSATFQILKSNAILKLHIQVVVSADTEMDTWQKSISVKDLLLIFAELGRTDIFHAASVSMFPCCQHYPLYCSKEIPVREAEPTTQRSANTVPQSS